MVYFNCTNLTSTEFGQLALARSVTAMILLVFVFLTSLYIACTHKTSLKTLLRRVFFYLTISTSVYLAVLSFDFKSPTNALCKSVGFLAQYSRTIQLLYSLEIVLVLFYKIGKLYRTGATDTNPQGLKCKYFFEALVLFVPWILPLPFAFMPFALVPYGETGPWCWIQSHTEDCSTIGHWERMGLWFIPFGVAACISMLCVLFILFGFLFLRLKKQLLVNKLIGEVLLLTIFLLAYFCLFATEVGCHFKAIGEDEYRIWMVYAISTPFSAIVIPIAFLIYLRYQLKGKNKQEDKESTVMSGPCETNADHLLTRSGEISVTETQPLLKNNRRIQT